MRIIIPKNLQEHDLFKQLKILADGMELNEFTASRIHDLPSLYELIRITNPNLNDDNIEFIYNAIFSKKGLLQVLRTMADYLHFELKTYEYNDYNLELLEIGNIVTDDSDHFFALFDDVLNALLFFGTLKKVINLLTQVIELVMYYRLPVVQIEESNYVEVTPVYNE